MELDDFLQNKPQDRRFDNDHRYKHSPSQAHDFRYPNQNHDTNYKWHYLLGKLKNNGKLKGLVITAFIVILAIIIGLIAVLLPLIIKLLTYISQNGLQGVLDVVTGFLDKLWKGSGK